ncbi:MAG: hypothetical protein LBQ33_05665, partial [Oscillospiraceae bacterium]|nr:hypothetical protein [Oscillospiraceae bacterium]
MKYLRKALSALLAFCMVFGVLVVGVSADSTTDSASVERGIEVYLYDATSKAFNATPLNSDDPVKVKAGDVLKVTSWTTSSTYVSSLTAAVYYDSRVYEPVMVTATGDVTPVDLTEAPRTLEDSQVYKSSPTNGLFALEGLDTAGSYANIFDWQIAFPLKISGMKESADGYTGAYNWFKYYPMAWFDRVTTDPDYPGGYNVAGDFAAPIAAYDTYSAIVAKGAFADGTTSEMENQISYAATAKESFVSFYLRVKPELTEATMPTGTGAGFLGLPEEALPGYVIQQTNDGWLGVTHAPWEVIDPDFGDVIPVEALTINNSPVYTAVMSKENALASAVADDAYEMTPGTTALDVAATESDTFTPELKDPVIPNAIFLKMDGSSAGASVQLPSATNTITPPALPTGNAGAGLSYVWIEKTTYDTKKAAGTLTKEDEASFTNLAGGDGGQNITFVAAGFRAYEFIYAYNATTEVKGSGESFVGDTIAWADL